METVNFEKDVVVICVKASSFPDGIEDAIVRLHGMVPFSPDREYYGIGRPENGGMVYRAGTAEKYPGEANKYNCETIVLKSGNYVSTIIEDYRKNRNRIGMAFQKLTSLPEVDLEGYGIEYYLSDRVAVRCMMRLKE